MSNITTYQAGIEISRNTCTSIAEAVKADGLNIYALAKIEGGKKAIMKEAYQLTKNFLSLMDMDKDTINATADAFAVDLVESRLDWKYQDIEMFFKTIRRRQDVPEFKVMGNKVTILKLNEMLAAYECLRSDAIVEIKQKEKYIASEHVEYGKGDEIAQQILDKLQAKGKPNGSAFIRAAETAQWWKDNEAKAQELRDMVAAGELTEDEALKQYDEYLLRK